MLCLHGGRFDHPDRMFNSIQQTWQNVLNGASDYKELVPEFYSGEGDFLVNYLGINFGQRSSDARPVQDVDLPPWASSPKEFIATLRYLIYPAFYLELFDSPHSHYFLLQPGIGVRVCFKTFTLMD